MGNTLSFCLSISAFLIGAVGCFGQEGGDMEFLLNDWVISYNESRDSVLVLRGIDDVHFLSNEDKKVIYPFKIDKDSTICRINFPKQPRFICLVGNPYGLYEGLEEDLKDNVLYEWWFLNSEKKQIRHAITSQNANENTFSESVYEALYSIKQIKRDYLELSLNYERVLGL